MTTATSIRQHIAYFNENYPSLKIQYEDLYNKNGKCNFASKLTQLYEMMTADYDNFKTSNKIRPDPKTLEKFYYTKKLMKILKFYLKKDELTVDRIIKPDNSLIVETLVLMRKLHSARLEVAKHANEFKDRVKTNLESKDYLDAQLKKLENNCVKGEDYSKNREKLSEVRKNIEKLYEIKNNLVDDIKKGEEEGTGLQNNIEITEKRLVDLEKEYKKILGWLRDAKNDILLNDVFIIQEKSRNEETLGFMEREKDDLTKFIERDNKRYSIMEELNKVIDEKMEQLKYIQKKNNELNIIDTNIIEEEKKCQEQMRANFIRVDELKEAYKTISFDTYCCNEIWREYLLPNLPVFDEKIYSDIEKFKNIKKEEYFKKRSQKDS
uniref:Uncharacterized protein n=1 Tax=Parastrongyloides trichosuri TaxID=131310 RepID=A0A0N4ZA29_PARTI